MQRVLEFTWPREIPKPENPEITFLPHQIQNNYDESLYRDLVGEYQWKTNTLFKMDISKDILKSIFD